MGTRVKVVLGGQVGDEGKGKIVDYLVHEFIANGEAGVIDIRTGGGRNAGHTVKRRLMPAPLKFHQVPSGLFERKCIGVMGNGMVIAVTPLVQEMENLRAQGVEITPARLKISDRAHLTLTPHEILDGAGTTSENTIGTTKRGIGQTYASKMLRDGLRVADMLDEAQFPNRVRTFLEKYNGLLAHYGRPTVDISQEVERMTAAAAVLRPYITDTRRFLYDAWQRSVAMVFEGAQGGLLDIDHGTYPYVTSSNATIGGVITGTGLPLQVFRDAEIIGVIKAYATRVGEGPFPTQMPEDLERKIRERAGDERGTSTDRPRKCGWLDLVALQNIAEINGFTTLALMKVDVLDALDTLSVGVAYKLDGKRITTYPARAEDLERVEVEFVHMPSWGSLAGCKTAADFPQALQGYVAEIAKRLRKDSDLAAVGIPVGVVSYGKDLEDTARLPRAN